MKYVALLRGINVGGNNLIKMSDLKKVFEENGYKKVITYIQSGNVVFETGEKDSRLITKQIEEMLSAAFNYKSKLVLRSYEQVKKIVDDAPDEWKKPNELRCYIAYIKEPVTVNEVLKEIQLKEGIDSVKAGKNVIYMSTRLSGLTKSGFTKLVAKKVYQDLTIRNYNTTLKLLALMEK